MDPRFEFMRAQYRATVGVALAITTIIPLLGWVTWIMLSGPADKVYTPLSEQVGLAALFGVLALVAVVGSFVIPGLLLRSIVNQGQSGSFSPQVRQAVGEDVSDPMYAVAGALYLSNLTAMAMCEIPTLLGFILTIQTGQWQVFALGAVITATMWAIHFPRFSAWESKYRAEEARINNIPLTITS